MNGFEVNIARRLGWKAEGRKCVSPAVTIAVTGVALAVIVMMISIAVMLGFKREVTKRILSLDDAITIAGYGDDASTPHAFNPAEIVSVISLPPEATAVGHTSLPTILKTPDDFLGLELRSRATTLLADTSLALSNGSASRLRLALGDRVPAYFFINNRLRVRMLTVDSLFTSSLGDLDRSVAYCSPALIEQLLGLEEGNVFSIGIRNVDEQQIEPLAASIYSELMQAHYIGNLSQAYGITTILQTDGQIFSWLRLLDTNVVVILTLMGLIAAFTLVSSLFIIILERVRTIGLLKSLGATNAQIRHIFMLMAERLVLRGMIIGNIIAGVLIALQYFWHLIPLDPENYYVDFVPVSLSATGVIALNLGVIIISWLILILPGLIISRISPAATMRYE